VAATHLTYFGVYDIIILFCIGKSLVYYLPGYFAFPEKPSYHNTFITPYGADIVLGRAAIDETFARLESDTALNFMVVYVDSPDETGHENGVTSVQVSYST